MLEPRCEVILCGNDPGVKEVSKEYGLMHLPNIDVNEYGTPLLNSAFDQVRQKAKHRLTCYVNADIIFLSDFTKAVKLIKYDNFLLIGQRIKIDITKLLNFKDVNWEDQLLMYANKYGVVTPLNVAGIDYFVFPKNSKIGDLLPFAVGRPGWDNWVIQHTRELRYPVIDATRVITAIHQNHGYGHVKDARDEIWSGPEGDKNLSLTNNINAPYTILDSTHFIMGSLVVRAMTPEYLKHKIKRKKQKMYKNTLIRKIISLLKALR